MSLAREQANVPANTRCEACGKEFYARAAWMTRCLSCHFEHKTETERLAQADRDAAWRIEAFERARERAS
jgi:hypothetical protein